jgi:hypothetical protein
VLSANLFHPSGHGFHDDEPAGKFENSVGIEAGNLFFPGCQGISIILFRLSGTLERCSLAGLKELAWLNPSTNRPRRNEPVL